MTRRTLAVATLLLVLALLPSGLFLAHVGGARWWAIPVEGDPGIAWMVVAETPEYRVLRDFAEPGATRRMHHHPEAAWHVLTVATGRLTLTVEGESPVEVMPGRPVTLRGGVMHTFTNPGAATATIVEVVGKLRP